MLKDLAKALLPEEAQQRLRRLRQLIVRATPIGWARFGNLRRLRPLAPDFGADRGQCIDRYYIERFLARQHADIRGHVLEIGDDLYTRRFGQGRVEKSDVLHVASNQPKQTIWADLTRAEQIPDDSFDCIIFTQTLQFIYDVHAAVRTLHRILRPGGTILATVPGISQISRYDMDRWGDYWRLTALSARRLFAEAFPKEQLHVEAHGNVLAAIAFLEGISAQELTGAELDYRDPDYEVLITVRATKPRGRAA